MGMLIKKKLWLPSVAPYYAAAGGGGFSVVGGTPSVVNGPQSAGAIAMGTVAYTPGCTYLLIAIHVDMGSVAPNTFGPVTVGGSNGTHVGSSFNYNNLSVVTDFWYFPSPPGSSAAIAVTIGSAISGNPGAITIKTWSVTSTTTTPTLGYAGGNSFNSGVTITGVVVPTGGAVVGIGSAGNSAPTMAFSNLTSAVVPYQTNDLATGQSTSLSGTVSVTLTDGVNNGFWEESLVTIAP